MVGAAVGLPILMVAQRIVRPQHRLDGGIETVSNRAPHQQLPAEEDHNGLIFEKSPYLLQHAHNPVDWHQWGPEAFQKAEKENRPVFLSIGYSTCHWCHVMAHESFEDPEVARMMNETFVCVKVDREERPDIDSVYMAVCQRMTGSGGWPLTIVMTPDRKPFFAATYIPKESRWGRTGMMELIPRLSDVWTSKPDEVRKLANEVTAALQGASQETAGEELGETTLRLAYEQLAGRFDQQHGGFSTAPKFPTPHQLTFLLRYWRRTSEQNALVMVNKTLTAMRCGGIYDHVGFGFHRYSTDAQWLVPHFEKMLYDQALLAIAYTEAYQATGEPGYRQTAQEILAYVLRELRAPQGGFYSAQDADSEGVEGKFYVWTEDEVRNVLEDDEADLVISVFNTQKQGNFAEEASGQETGANILHLKKPISLLSSELSVSEQYLRERLEVARKKLFAHRESRVRPATDDKILTDWNGLMVAALAKGAQVFDAPAYSEAAQRAADFILNNMRTPEGRLLHRYRDGEAAISAYLDDYAFLIWGLIELYETRFEVDYLRTALQLHEDLVQRFWDENHGGFYLTAKDDEALLTRPKDIYDGATPSGNSVAALNLLRLGRMTANPGFEDYAAQIGRAFGQQVNRLPSGHTQLMAAVDLAVGPAYEVVIAGKSEASDTATMLRALRAPFLPNKVVLFRPHEEETPQITALAEYVKYQPSINGKATAYVCRSYQCELPTTDSHQMLELLGAK